MRFTDLVLLTLVSSGRMCPLRAEVGVVPLKETLGKVKDTWTGEPSSREGEMSRAGGIWQKSRWEKIREQGG